MCFILYKLPFYNMVGNINCVANLNNDSFIWAMINCTCDFVHGVDGTYGVIDGRKFHLLFFQYRKQKVQ